MATNEIIQELKDLQSDLPVPQPPMPYLAPQGYFEGLAAAVLRRIKAEDAADARSELDILSPLLSSLPRSTPYQVPVGYFEELGISTEAAMMADEDSVAKELDALSPLLGGLKQQPTYTVPAGYFEQLSIPVAEGNEKKGTVIAMSNKWNWRRYTAAVSVVLLLAVGSLLIFNKRSDSIDPNANSYAWIEKNMKKVSQDEIDELVKLADAVSPAIASNGNNAVNDIKELMKNVPDSDIEHFLNDVDTEIDTEDNDPLLN